MTEAKTMRAWRAHQWGQPSEVLQLDTIPIPEPGAGELLVRAQGIPLNLNDMERVTGANMMVRPELPVTPGMEVMGEVAACGDGIGDEWLGRRVVAMPKQATGGWAEYSICPLVSAFEMPADVAMPGAAALYFPYHLAWIGLVDRANLQTGENVLIHAAAGGSGSAAVQLAKRRGARVFATVGSEEKRALCERLGADVVINYSDEDFGEIIMEATENRGVEVVFDNVGEAVMEKSMAVTAYNGRYLMMGFASDKKYVDEPFIVPRRVSAGNFHLCGVLLSYAPEPIIPIMKKGMGWNFCPNALGAQIMREIVDGVRDGSFEPVIGRVASFDEIPAEMQALFERKTTGRTIIALD